MADYPKHVCPGYRIEAHQVCVLPDSESRQGLFAD